MYVCVDVYIILRKGSNYESTSKVGDFKWFSFSLAQSIQNLLNMCEHVQIPVNVGFAIPETSTQTGPCLGCVGGVVRSHSIISSKSCPSQKSTGFFINFSFSSFLMHHQYR